MINLEEARKYLFEERKIILLTNNNPLPIQNNRRLAMLLSVNEELEQLPGKYCLPDHCLLYMTEEELIFFHNNLLPMLRDKISGGVNNVISFLSFKRFPDNIMSSREVESWIKKHLDYNKIYKIYNRNKILHPWYGRRYLNHLGSIHVRQLQNSLNGTAINVVGLRNYCLSLFDTIGNYDLEMLSHAAHLCGLDLPNRIPSTLNRAVLREDFDIEYTGIVDAMATILSWIGKTIIRGSLGGYVIYPLHIDVKHTVVSREKRKRAAELIESMVDKFGLDKCVRDAWKYRRLWQQMNRKYFHLGDYRTKYPKAFQFIDAIHNGKPSDWNKKYKFALEQTGIQNFEEFVDDLVANNPNEFLTKFNSLAQFGLRNQFDIETYLIDKLYDLKNFDPMKLIRLINFLVRMYLYKIPPKYYDDFGNTMGVKDRCTKEFPVDLVQETIFILQNLLNIHISDCGKGSRNPYQGFKVFIDPSLFNIPILYGMTSSDKICPRGVRVEIPREAYAVRLFVLGKSSTMVTWDETCGGTETFKMCDNDMRLSVRYVDLSKGFAKPIYKSLISDITKKNLREDSEIVIGCKFLNKNEFEDDKEKLDTAVENADHVLRFSILKESKELLSHIIDVEKREIVLAGVDSYDFPNYVKGSDKTLRSWFFPPHSISVGTVLRDRYRSLGGEIVGKESDSDIKVNFQNINDTYEDILLAL